MRLTFIENKFTLLTPPTVAAPSDGKWKTITPGHFTTKDMSAAARFRKYADGKAENIFKKLMLKVYPFPPGGVRSPIPLYPFQSERGVPHILTHNRTYLAHQPGLGKTAQAVCAVNSKPGRTLIICPAFLKTTWAREITKWCGRDFPSIAVLPETANQEAMNWFADFIIASDAMLLREWVRLGLLKQEFKYIFIDEAHRFKDPGTSRTIALFGGSSKLIKAPGLVYTSEHVCLLSGTPILNRPIELWPILFALGPELIDFMTYESFGFRYGGAVQDERGHWRFIGSANEDDLKSRIMGRFMQRITKQEVLTDLPDKVREVIYVDRDTRAVDVKAMDQELLKQLRRSDFQKPSELGEYAAIRHANGLAKAAWAAEYVLQLLTYNDDESIIIYAHHRDVVGALSRALQLFKPMVITGDTPFEIRTMYEDAFQSGKRRVIIGNIDAMNLGLTLTRGSRCVFVEYAWTPALNEQAEDRLHRIGQKDSVLCQYLVLPGSIDEAILQANLMKESSIRKVME